MIIPVADERSLAAAPLFQECGHWARVAPARRFDDDFRPEYRGEDSRYQRDVYTSRLALTDQPQLGHARGTSTGHHGLGDLARRVVELIPDRVTEVCRMS